MIFMLSKYNSRLILIGKKEALANDRMKLPKKVQIFCLSLSLLLSLIHHRNHHYHLLLL